MTPTGEHGRSKGNEMQAAQAELGWRWPVQQAIWNDLIAPHDNEWTTFSDAAGLTEFVARTLAEQGYEVVKVIAEVYPTTVYQGYACDRFETTWRKSGIAKRVLVVEADRG